MPKLIKIYAIMVAWISYFVNITAWDERSDSHHQAIQNHSNLPTISEDVEDIANKLWNKAIKIDPNFWLNKNIQNYPTQLNATIVKDGLLTQDEVQYVSWSDYTVSQAIMAKDPAHFTIKKDGASATGNVILDASTGETTKQIATKIIQAHIRLNYAYWNEKTFTQDLSLARSILVNEHILTKAEASVVVGFVSPVTITNVGSFAINFDVDDEKTNTDANTYLNVVDDGWSSEQIATNLTEAGQYGETGGWEQNNVYFLKENMTGLYADNPAVTKNFHDLLNNYGSTAWNKSDTSYVTLEHKILTNAPNGNDIKAIINKDGQIATPVLDIVAYNKPYFICSGQDDTDFEGVINLNPTIMKYLRSKVIFDPNKTDALVYFYQVLDDFHFYDVPVTSGPEYITWWNRMETYMGDFGRDTDTDSYIAECEMETTSNPGNTAFDNALYNKIINPSTNYLTVDFSWYYEGEGDYTTYWYSFW